MDPEKEMQRLVEDAVIAGLVRQHAATGRYPESLSILQIAEKAVQAAWGSMQGGDDGTGTAQEKK